MRDVRLGVEIDNSRIVEVMPLAYGASGTMDLAAIERGQRRALVRLYVLCAGPSAPSSPRWTSETSPRSPIDERF